MAKKTVKEDVAKTPIKQPVVVEEAKSKKKLVVHESGQLGYWDDEHNFVPA